MGGERAYARSPPIFSVFFPLEAVEPLNQNRICKKDAAWRPFA